MEGLCALWHVAGKTREDAAAIALHEGREGYRYATDHELVPAAFENVARLLASRVTRDCVAVYDTSTHKDAYTFFYYNPATAKENCYNHVHGAYAQVPRHCDVVLVLGPGEAPPPWVHVDEIGRGVEWMFAVAPSFTGSSHDAYMDYTRKYLKQLVTITTHHFGLEQQRLKRIYARQ